MVKLNTAECKLSKQEQESAAIVKRLKDRNSDITAQKEDQEQHLKHLCIQTSEE